LRIANQPYLKTFLREFSFRHCKKRDRIKLACQKSSTSRIFDLTPLSGQLLKSFYVDERLLPYFSKYRSYKLLSRPFLEHLLKFKDKVNIDKIFLSPDIKHLINPGEISCVRVTSKKIISNRYKFVYDFTVPKNHNFIAERIIIHNTSILDFVRKTKIAEKETGGITQHIGAYQIEHQGKKITFIDTPGHEAFSAMRSRGARVADIAVLVVAAEEGVKPQTKEAIKHIKKTGVPTIVALNKIDKKEAQPERVKKQLAENGIVVESLGGDVPSVNVSAKTGQGIGELLEMINLVAEMEAFESKPDQPATGVVIESRQDSKRGATATLLVKEGTLKNKDIIGTDSSFGKIKTMEDFRSQPIKKATPSTPTIVTGLNQVPQVGEKFYVFKSIEEAQERVEKKTAKRDIAGGDSREVFVFEPGKKVLNIILKADVFGSLEAIKESLKSIPSEEAALRILKSEVGDITESDIKLAESAQAKIIGFRIKVDSQIERLAQQRKIKILTFDIIYELIQGVRDLLAKLLEPEIVRNVLGQLKILAVFKTEKDRQIVGGKVIQGLVKKGALIDVLRDNKKIGQGAIVQLQRDKKDVDEVSKGQEAGLLVKGVTSIEKGDILEIYQEEKRKKEL
jgi:translation initiation factor IF-2